MSSWSRSWASSPVAGMTMVLTLVSWGKRGSEWSGCTLDPRGRAPGPLAHLRHFLHLDLKGERGRVVVDVQHKHKDSELRHLRDRVGSAVLRSGGRRSWAPAPRGLQTEHRHNPAAHEAASAPESSTGAGQGGGGPAKPFVRTVGERSRCFRNYYSQEQGREKEKP